MLTVDIPAYIFKYGSFELRWYGLVYAFTYLLCLWFLMRNYKKLKMNYPQTESLMFWLLGGMLVGARVMHFLINDPIMFITEPWRLFTIWRGGMSFFGAFLGILGFGYYWMKKNKKNFLATADVLVVPIAFGIALGRIANLLNQELVGTVTNVNWCFMFKGYSQCRHPYVLYASFTHFLLFGILLYVTKIKNMKKMRDGVVLLAFTLFYTILRFIVDFWREDLRFLGLTSWQYISIIVFSIGLYFLIKFKKALLHQTED